MESVFCDSRSTSIYLALSYEASEICKLSRKLPADFQELPLSAGLVLNALSVAREQNAPRLYGSTATANVP